MKLSHCAVLIFQPNIIHLHTVGYHTLLTMRANMPGTVTRSATSTGLPSFSSVVLSKFCRSYVLNPVDL